MSWWNSVQSMWAVWWIFPLMCVAVMIIMCVVFRRRGGHGGMCCGWRPTDEMDDLRREMRELRDEIAKIKTK